MLKFAFLVTVLSIQSAKVSLKINIKLSECHVVVVGGSFENLTFVGLKVNRKCKYLLVKMTDQKHDNCKEFYPVFKSGRYVVSVQF